MDSFLLMLIATSGFISVKANEEPRIEIYEIRKTRDDPDLRLDFQYYDPNEEKLDQARYNLNFENHKKRNSNVDIVTSNLINKLRRIVNSKYYDSSRKDDYITNYKNLKADNIIDDEKTPVVIIADNRVLYHLIPQKSRSLHHKLQSALRSINENEVEDRTAPPRTKIVYDYDYD